MKPRPLTAIFGSLLLLGPPRTGAQEIQSLPAPEQRQAVIRRAESYLGVDYSYGGSDVRGMDCSGLVYRVFLEAADLELPRAVAALYGYGSEIAGSLLPGDLVFFDTDGREPSHVGIYAGGGHMIHAASRGPETGVILSSLNEPYYSRRFLRARRVLSGGPLQLTIDLSVGQTLPEAMPAVPAGYPLEIAVRGVSERLLTVRLERGGQTWLSRRLLLQPPAAKLWFTPTAGDWRAVCEDEGGGVLAALEFSAGRKP